MTIHLTEQQEKEKLRAFFKDIEGVQNKHNLQLVALLNYTPQGMIPTISATHKQDKGNNNG